MPLRTYIITFIVIIVVASTIIFVSSRNNSKLKSRITDYGLQTADIQKALDSGNYTKLLELGIIDKIPTTKSEIAALNSKLKTQNSKLKKVIRDRSGYAKKSPQATDNGKAPNDGEAKKMTGEALNDNVAYYNDEVQEYPSNESNLSTTNDAPDKTTTDHRSPITDYHDSSVPDGIDPALQEALLQQSVQSNDVVLRMKKVNSDYIDAIATNNGAVWLMGLTGKHWDLRADYGKRLFEIPGVGYYLLPKDVAPDDADFIKEKISVLEEALSLKPDSPELAHKLALSYAKDGGNLDKAMATINDIAIKSPGKVDLEYEKAEVLRAASENQNYANQKDDLINRALENYEIAARTSRNPNTIAKSAINANKILAKRGETQQGVKLLEDAYYDTKQKMSDGNNRQIVRELGQHYYNEGDYDTALNWYDKGNNNDWAFEYAKGKIYEKLGDRNNAIKNYKRSVRLNPGQFGPNIKLITTYAKNGQLYEANQALRKFNNQLNKNSKKRRTSIKNSSSYKAAIELLNKK